MPRSKLTQNLIYRFRSEIRQQALTYYMAHFEFGGIDVDESIRYDAEPVHGANQLTFRTRLLCNKLYIKGETQQIDRVLEAFSEHYMFQNPNSIWRFAGKL
jgi:hypothetical protein